MDRKRLGLVDVYDSSVEITVGHFDGCSARDACNTVGRRLIERLIFLLQEPYCLDTSHLENTSNHVNSFAFSLQKKMFNFCFISQRLVNHCYRSDLSDCVNRAQQEVGDVTHNCCAKKAVGERKVECSRFVFVSGHIFSDKRTYDNWAS